MATSSKRVVGVASCNLVDRSLVFHGLFATITAVQFPSDTRLMMVRVARKFLIRGEVQGVGYRFFAQRAAAKHQVTGYVRNCADGTVEALAEGSPIDVEEFKKDLVTGPQWASVGQVEEISLEPAGRYASFLIER